VVWLLDIRRELSVEDHEIQQLLAESGRPVLAVLTKADKLTRSELTLRVRTLAGALALPSDQIQVTSTRTGLGISELAAGVAAAAQGET
jgi:GTP-binding protein